MKTPVVTVMRTQGARRRHQQAVESKRFQKWLDSQRLRSREIEEKIHRERVEYCRLLSRLSERISTDQFGFGQW